MARPRSAHVVEVLEMLRSRLSRGVYRRGERFLSNRALAARFGISYQTADRVIRALCEDGLLTRRPQAGTYVAGERVTLRGAQLIFHARARRDESFGARLLRDLTAALRREGVDAVAHWDDGGRRAVRLSPDRLPVLWESPTTHQACVAAQRPALLLNTTPAPGLESTFLDSVSTDNFCGGACAAQVLRPRLRRIASPRVAVVAGPPDDPRNADRVAGFRSILPDAQVMPADTWGYDGGARLAAAAVRAGAHGLFCVNDRLAQAILDHCRANGLPPPPLVGFDDAPIAERLNLTTIAIPWADLIAAAVGVVRRRLTNRPSTASRQIFAPAIVRRSL